MKNICQTINGSSEYKKKEHTGIHGSNEQLMLYYRIKLASKQMPYVKEKSNYLDVTRNI